MSNLPAIIQNMAVARDVDPQEFHDTMLATIFPSGQQATVPQLLAFLFVADKYGLDPWCKQIYAFPSQGGVTPIMGYDGWVKFANGSPHYDGAEIEFGEEGGDTFCKVTIHRKDRQFSPPIVEWLSECKRNTKNWKDMPQRMLRNRTYCQAVRLSFGLGGVYLPDEAETFSQAPRDVAAEEVKATNALLAPQDPVNAPEDLNYVPPAEEPHSEPQGPSVLSDADADAAEAARADEGLFEEGSPSYD